MPVHTLDQNHDLEERGKAELVLVGVRYVGNKSSVPVGKYQRSSGWPGASPLQGGPIQEDGTRAPGPVQLALVPDWTDEDVESRTVLALENDPDIEVLYDRERIAKALLDRNYLPPRVFDRGYDVDLRDRVFDALGLEDVGRKNVAGYREQLREIAGLDPDDVETDSIRDAGRVGEYKTDYRRSTLLEAATALGGDFDRSTSRTELAEWLADQDATDVERALEDPDRVDYVVEEGTDQTETKHSIVTAPEKFTVSEIEDELATGEYDEHLETLGENERSGKDRTTVYEAIDQRQAGDS